MNRPCMQLRSVFHQVLTFPSIAINRITPPGAWPLYYLNVINSFNESKWLFQIKHDHDRDFKISSQLNGTEISHTLSYIIDRAKRYPVPTRFCILCLCFCVVTRLSYLATKLFTTRPTDVCSMYILRNIIF